MVKTAIEATAYGASVRGRETEFRVWAPQARRVTLRLLGRGDFPMRREDGGAFARTLPARAGERYFYIVDEGKPVPDPVSRLLPAGVHGPTEIVDPEAFRWSDSSPHLPKAGKCGAPSPSAPSDLREYVIYELHVGTFSREGTFDGAIARLPYLRELGVTVLELMPVAAFPGRRNWGYDGVSPYAVQASYGGPDGLKRLVEAAHGAGLAVLLDVVYNHLGNEGNYLRLFGPYFTDQHKTPWGDAINYDQAGSDGVRRYVVENALYWIREYHLDGLRLDAIQTIHDDSRPHIVAEIARAVHALGRELGRQVTVIAETDENRAEYVRPEGAGGLGLDAVWSDDFHHALHALLTGERAGYYQDFGRREQIAKALNEGFVFQGEHFKFWGAPRGNSPAGVPLYRHVICTQNHDQAGNRARGERLTALVPRGARKLAAALLLLAPHTPLLFMGQEYDEPAPFQFFTDYGDPALQKAASEGRRREFKDFRWEDVPDPQDIATFERSKLQWPVAGGRWREQLPVASRQSPEQEMLEWCRQLITLRKSVVTPGPRTCRAEVRAGAIVMQAPAEEPQLMVMAEFPDSQRVPAPAGWKQVMAADEDGFRVVVLTKYF
jgi:maltooligosyltrehalose trehalohydrolase